MSIANVKALQALKAKLESYTWSTVAILGDMQYSKGVTLPGTQQLSVEEDELLESILAASALPMTVGLAIKKLVMLRLDTAINHAAKEARAEAQRVLDLLGDE